MTSLPEDSLNLAKKSPNSDAVSNLVDLLWELQSQEQTDSTSNTENDSELPPIDVAIDADLSGKMTLNEAVEYRAFLRQTIDESDNLNTGELTASFDKSESQLIPANESLDLLLPLIVELLNSKSADLRESILQAITPVIDRIIEQRSLQDSPKMAAAIAKILPHAIAEEIKLSPLAIAKAIAPEIAVAIREQITLDNDAISDALGSEMGKAIKTQIELEKDAMVDALYPVIGSTISKYMVEVVQSINEKVENALSVGGFKRKIRARLKGVSEAELILQEAVGYTIQAIFLIDKDSGLIIEEIQPNNEKRLESDLVAGMLTAIRSFANDCIASGSELNEIDYGDWQIPLEVAGYCYLAVVVKGEPDKKFRQQIRHTLEELTLKYGDEIEVYEGDRSTISPEIGNLLTRLLEPELSETSKSSKKGKPTTLLWILTLLLSIVLITWGVDRYRQVNATRIERDTAIALDAAPELSVYRIEPEVDRGQLILTGRVPNAYLRERAESIGENIAISQNLLLNNQILTVDVPENLQSTLRQIQDLTQWFNQQSGIAIDSRYLKGDVEIGGFILQANDWESIYSAYRQIPGLDRVIIKAAKELPKFEPRFYFALNSIDINLNNETKQRKIGAIEEFLIRYPQLNLKLIAHSDSIGEIEQNQKLGQQRVEIVRQEIIDRGIDSSRLELKVSDRPPSDLQNNLPSWLSRCVRVEPFLPAKQNNQNNVSN
jgi:outer membrane protein OmpA-like peptidoglycan-associated protein